MSTEVTPTEGPWRPGKVWGSVVADHAVPGVRGSDDVDYYGGHLIAESISPQNVPIIAAAWEMLVAIESFMPKGIVIGNSNVPDDIVVPMDVTMGELRAFEAAITKARGGAQ